MFRSNHWFQWVIAILLAMLFWLSVALVKEYHFTISLPIKYENYPERLKLLNTMPDHILAGVRGKGIHLLFPSLGYNIDTVKINLSQVIKKGHIKTADVLLGEKIFNTLNFTHIQPDSIFLFFEEKIEKKVVVIPEAKMHIRDGFQYYKPFKLTPDSVILVGTQSDLRHISAWHTIEQNIPNIHQSGTVSLKMEHSPDLMVVPEEVKLEYFVNKYVEVIEMRTVEVRQTPPKYHVKILPEKVLVKILVPAEKYDHYNASSLRIWVDYNKLVSGATAVKPNISFDSTEVFSAYTEPQWLPFIVQKYNP